MHYMDMDEAYRRLDGICGKDNAFPGQHRFQLGIRSGYLTLINKVPYARVVRCAARLEG